MQHVMFIVDEEDPDEVNLNRRHRNMGLSLLLLLDAKAREEMRLQCYNACKICLHQRLWEWCLLLARYRLSVIASCVTIQETVMNKQMRSVFFHARRGVFYGPCLDATTFPYSPQRVLEEEGVPMGKTK